MRDMLERTCPKCSCEFSKEQCPAYKGHWFLYMPEWVNGYCPVCIKGLLSGFHTSLVLIDAGKGPDCALCPSFARCVTLYV